MAGDWLKVIISHHFYEDNLNFFYNCQKHLQEITYVVFLCLWKKLDFVLFMWLKWFCLLREFSNPVFVLYLILPITQAIYEKNIATIILTSEILKIFPVRS